MQPGDWPAVAAIYAEGIATGNATFETAVPALRALGRRAPGGAPPRRARRRPASSAGPRSAPYSAPRRSTRGVAEDTHLHRRGGARAGRRPAGSCGRSIEGAERAGIWTLQAGIFPENAREHRAARALRLPHRRHCASASAGCDGVWRDVVLMERRSAVVGMSERDRRHRPRAGGRAARLRGRAPARSTATLLGLPELAKPAALQPAAAAGSPAATQQLHVGVERSLRRRATKAHPALRVRDATALAALLARLDAAGCPTRGDVDARRASSAPSSTTRSATASSSSPPRADAGVSPAPAVAYRPRDAGSRQRHAHRPRLEGRPRRASRARRQARPARRGDGPRAHRQARRAHGRARDDADGRAQARRARRAAGHGRRGQGRHRQALPRRASTR